MTQPQKEVIYKLPLTEFPGDCDWPIQSLATTADILGGGTPDTGVAEYWEPAEIPWATPTDITGTDGNDIVGTERSISEAGLKQSTLIPENSVLMTSRATIGAAKINRVPMAINQGFAAFVPKPGYSSEYIFHLIEILKPTLVRLGAGTTFLETSRREIKKVLARIPEENEQRRIAAALKLADVAIAKAKAELEAARELKRSLEDSLLSGKLDKKSQKKKKTKAGEIPTDWNFAPMKEIANIDSGVTLNQDRAPRDYPCRYLTVAHVKREAISNEDPRYLELLPAERDTRLLTYGDVLVVEGHANSLEIGRAAMFEGFDEPTTFQNHLFRIRPNRSQLLPKFLLYLLNSERVQKHWNAICNTSSGLNTINRRNLRNLQVQFPDASEQKKILSVLEASEKCVFSFVDKLTALKALKKSLLQNLLIGKIRIPEGTIHE
jgi:type I restriction enzyme, S subunit